MQGSDGLGILTSRDLGEVFPADTGCPRDTGQLGSSFLPAVCVSGRLFTLDFGLSMASSAICVPDRRQRRVLAFPSLSFFWSSTASHERHESRPSAQRLRIAKSNQLKKARIRRRSGDQIADCTKKSVRTALPSKSYPQQSCQSQRDRPRHRIIGRGNLRIIQIVGATSPLSHMFLIKGILLLVLSPETESRVFIVGLHYEQHPNLYAAFVLLLGAYLTYAGFRSTTCSLK
jgi:hypothetical protein